MDRIEVTEELKDLRKLMELIRVHIGIQSNDGRDTRLKFGLVEIDIKYGQGRRASIQNLVLRYPKGTAKGYTDYVTMTGRPFQFDFVRGEGKFYLNLKKLRERIELYQERAEDNKRVIDEVQQNERDEKENSKNIIQSLVIPERGGMSATVRGDVIVLQLCLTIDGAREVIRHIKQQKIL